MARFGRNQLDETTASPFTADHPTEDDTVTTLNDDLTGLPPAESVPEVPSEAPAVLDGVTENGKRRGRPKLADLPSVNVADLMVTDLVPEDEWAANPVATSGSTAIRSDAQVVVDGKVKLVHDAWVEAGRPEPARSPRTRITVKPEFAQATRGMITSAALKLKVKADAEKIVQSDGMVSWVITACDRPVKVKAESK